MSATPPGKFRALTKCPCCGSESPVDLLASLDTNTIAYQGKSTAVYPRPAMDLVYTLAKAWPGTVSLDRIAQSIWGLREPEGYVNCVETYACRARKFLREIGLGIKFVPGRGYRLTLPEDQIK